MSLLVYGITDHLSPFHDELLGVGEVAVKRIAAAGLVALTSEHDTMPAPLEEDLWRFEHVIESGLLSGPILPARFGTLLETVQAVEQMLQTRGRELHDKLERVRGAVELSVRGVWPEAAEPVAAGAAATGTEYLQARLEPQRRAQQIADRLQARLEVRARASRVQILTRTRVPVTAAFLVDHGTEAEFLRAVSRLDAELADTELVCTGPWPAYSFVGDCSDG